MEHNQRQVKYPNILKLKEKYSPQRRLKSPSRGGSEVFNKNYQIFAKAPRRSLGDVKLERPHSSDLIQRSNTDGAQDYENSKSLSRKIGLFSENRPMHLGIDPSPVRTSGSPVRRKRIAELDHSEGLHTNELILADSHGRVKKQKVSFDDRVAIDRSMSAELKTEKMSLNEVTTDNKGEQMENDNNDNEILRTLHRIEASLLDVHQRLDYMESRQITLEKFIHIFKPTSNLSDRIEQLEKKLETCDSTPLDNIENI